MDTAAIKKHISEDNWYGILKAAGCTTKDVSPEIQEMTKKKDIPTLLNVAIAYGQLSNLRVIKKKSAGKEAKNLTSKKPMTVSKMPLPSIGTS